MYDTKISKKKLKFSNAEVNKKEFHTSKTPIAWNSVDIDKIVVSKKFKRNDSASKFIGYKEDDIIMHLSIVLPQISGYLKHFDNGGKDMSFKIEDENIFVKYNEIWNTIKKTLNIKNHTKTDYDEKFIKLK